jgi:5-(carboxyamino)imidazole ribonucleotide mutase/phosphoribosylaminoimidazole-succinocarboxamide synthase
MAGFVPILVGSRNDLNHAHLVAESLRAFGVESEIRVGSAHKTPQHLLALLGAYEADPRPKVYVTIAGRSNALSGLVDAQVLSPVIACAPISTHFGGADIYSSLRMPSAVAPLVILEPASAALAAAKILALADAELRGRIQAFQQRIRDTIIHDDGEVRGTGET